MDGRHMLSRLSEDFEAWLYDWFVVVPVAFWQGVRLGWADCGGDSERNGGGNLPKGPVG